MTDIKTLEQQPKILIIDEHLPTRLVAKSLLESNGYEVKTYETGVDALQTFDEYKPDLVLLDVLMPELDGFSVCKKIRTKESGQSTPIIMMAGLDDVDSIDHAYEAGATDFILKPINCTVLRHRVKYILRANNAMTSLSHSLDQVKHMAYYDSITGLPNRDYFKQYMDEYLAICEENQIQGAVLFLDLDRFKRVNDTLGHTAGDELLLEVADRLRKSLRTADLIVPSDSMHELPLISRFGGDEFAVILNDVSEREVIDRVVKRVITGFNKPIDIGENPIYVTASIGISLFPDDGIDAETLLKHADIAMYHSKDFGRNNFSYYNQNMNSRSYECLALETNLRKALEDEQFVLYFQPKYCARDGAISGVELLIRWNHPQLGLFSPHEFISTAEENGLIIPITEWIIKKIGQFHQRFLVEGLTPIIFSINISATHFKQVDFVENTYRIIEEYQIPPSLIEMEITENSLFETLEWTQSSIYNLQKYHIKLAIDDFGTGYSSLAYLKKFPINRLKIDKQFISDIGKNNEDEAITRAIVAIAKNLNIKITAEGVETREQLDYLTDLGVDEIQGFYFSEPLKEDDFFDLLHEAVSEKSNSSRDI